ncbi:MAG: phytoene desaturase family protein [Microthrixaceae bacterium]
MRIVIVGAGLGGLSAACHLAGNGHDVTILEKATVPGGRAGLLDLDGYAFDTGPTVMTMTDLLDDTFAAAGAERRDHVELTRLDPAYRALFADGSELHVKAGREAMTQEIREKIGPTDAANFGRFADWLQELYEVEQPNFIDADLSNPLSMLKNPGALVKLLQLGGLRKLHNVVGDYFQDDRLHRIFSFQAMYAGLSPFEALAIYGVITYMDSVAGVYGVQGGMHSVPRGLADAAEKAGAQVRYGEVVEKVTKSPSGRVDGVLLAGGERITADAVVMNADVPVAYRQLLDATPPLVTRVGRYSPSCAVWLVGVKGDLPEGTTHHNIHFGGQWNEAFQALLKDGRRMPDPSILVTAPTVTDPGLAPDGRNILYVLEPVPNLDGKVDWHRERDRIRDQLAAKVGELGYPTDIEVEHLTDPLDWQQQGMERGTPFALAHRFFQTGPFRPHLEDRRHDGVVFVGSGTIPGVGIPMVLISGKLAAARVEAMGRKGGIR